MGQEVSLRSISKGSEIEENSASADGESSRSDLTPPREAKRAKHDDKGEDSRQWTRLHHQVADMTARSCQLALTPPQEGSGERGASAIDVDAKGPGGMTALHLAACRGTYGDGSSLEDDKDSDDSGAAMVSDLLNLGAKYGAKTDETEETPLHLAARYSRADVAKRLLDSGADANSRDRLNRTPLHLAIGADAQGVFQILLRNRATDLEAKMDDGTSPLILASRHDLPELVRHLVKAGVKVNGADNQGRTALHWAASVNSLEVTKELLRNGAKKDAQDEKGQTPLFLGCREGSNQTVRHLLVNYANRKLADNMDMTPEDIAKQRHHHDIVELLTDWSLGCNSPKAVPAPTSPPEGHQSPLTSMASPSATSPPAVEILTGNGPPMVARFQAARPKTTAVSRSQGAPRQRSNAQGNNSNAKRKRKKARNDEESYPAMTSVTKLSPTASLSPIANHPVTSCATGPSFSPSCVPMANGLSPLGSVGISPADSTTFSPVHGGPNPLDSPLEILSPEDLKDLEIDVWDGLDDIVPFGDPTDMSLCGFPPTTVTAGNLDVMDHIVPTTSDCMYLPNNAPPVRRVDPPQGQRLHSVHSTPDLNLLQQDSRPIVFNGRTCSSAQKAPPTPSQLASYHALTNSNMYPGGVNLMPPSKDFSSNDYLLHQHPQLQDQLYVRGQPTPTVCTFLRGGYDCVSPQKPLSFPTPSPDSPGQWSSSSSSSSC